MHIFVETCILVNRFVTDTQQAVYSLKTSFKRCTQM